VSWISDDTIAESEVIYTFYVDHRDVGNVTPKRSKGALEIVQRYKDPVDLISCCFALQGDRSGILLLLRLL